MYFFLFLGAVAFFAAAPSASAAAKPEIVLEGNPPVVRVRSALLPGTGDWTAILRVSVDAPDAPRLAGAYAVQPGVLTFTPRYPLQPGLAYRAAFRTGADSVTVVTLTPETASASRPAAVQAVYPSTGVWPENQLRFYIHFSGSMSRGEAFERIHLLDRDRGDAEIKLPFLEIDQELWDREQQRLTILFDPGRVKRGLVPNQEAGPPLVDGGHYLLVIDGEWKDSSNRPLQAAFRKEFRVGPAIRDGIDVKQWNLAVPAAGTRDPLRITFPRPLDSALLMRCISVEGVAGEASMDGAETQWIFRPAEPWKAGAAPHHVVVQEILEDLAGNKVGRPFDVDRFDRVDRKVVNSSVKIPFTLSPARR